jgi:hypothetical protein
LFPGDLRLCGLFLYFVLSGFKFTVQIDGAYLKGRLMSLQHMFTPTIGVHEGSTGTMENSPVKKQWIPTYSAIHLLTSCT